MVEILNDRQLYAVMQSTQLFFLKRGHLRERERERERDLSWVYELPESASLFINNKVE